MSLPLSEIVWSRPQGLVLWLLVLLLLLLLRRKAVPVERATGTLDLWREVVQREDRSPGGRARRLPARVWWLVAAIIAGGLAVAGPRSRSAQQEALWHFELDRSPSMFLPHGEPSGPSRYEVALEGALAWLDEHGVAQGARVWRSAGLASVRAGRPPQAWAEEPRLAVPELRPPNSAAQAGWPPWNLVTDRAPAGLPDGVGFFASGGVQVPGAVGLHGGRLLLWDGVKVVEGGVAPRRLVHVDERAPVELAELAGIWVEERGLQLSADETRADLRVILEEGGRGPTRSARGPGWELQVITCRDGSSPRAPLAGFETWLVSQEDEVPLVRIGPGEIRLGFSEIVALGGDDAAFAVSWSELFDRTLPPAPDTLTLDERRAAGSGAMGRPHPSDGREGAAEPGILPAAWLALLATLCAWVALGPAGGGKRLSSRLRRGYARS